MRVLGTRRSSRGGISGDEKVTYSLPLNEQKRKVTEV